MVTKEEFIVIITNSIESKIELLNESFVLLDKDINDKSVPTTRLVNNPKQLRYQLALLLKLKGLTYAEIGKIFDVSAERVRQLVIFGMRSFYEKKFSSPFNQSINNICKETKGDKVNPFNVTEQFKKIEQIKNIIASAEKYVLRRKTYAPKLTKVKKSKLKIFVFNHFHNFKPTIVFAKDHAEAVSLVKGLGVDGVPSAYWETYNVSELPTESGVLKLNRD